MFQRSASWSNKQQAKIFSTTIPKMFSTQVLRQLSGHLHPANVLSAILFNLGFTAGQIKSAVSGTDMAFKESYLERDGHRERFTCSERTQQAVLLLNQVRWQIVQGYTVARLIASGVLFYRDVLPEDAVAIVAPVKRKAVPQPCVSKRRRLEPEQTIKDLCDRVDKLKERVSATGKNVGKMRSSILKKLVNITRKLDTILG